MLHFDLFPCLPLLALSLSSSSSPSLLLFPGCVWARAGTGAGAGIEAARTGTTPVTVPVKAEGPGTGVKEGVVEVGAVVAGVRLRALTVLLTSLVPTPKTALLDISSILICPLFSGISFLPFAAVLCLVPASLSCALGAVPVALSPNLKA